MSEAFGSIDRRGFLLSAGLVGTSLAFTSCSDDGRTDRGARSDGTPSPDDLDGLFGELRRVRAAIRSGPDHLVERADEIVMSKDPLAAVAFVASSVAVLPPNRAGVDHMTFGRWGTAGTLRCGGGTLRERADLLVELMTRMGLTAEVRSAPRPADIDRAAFAAPTTPAHDPGVLDFLRSDDRFGDVFGASKDAGGIDPDGAADRLLAALGNAPTAQRLVMADLPPTIPVVEFDAGDGKRWAYCLGPEPVVDTEPAGMALTIPTILPTVSVRLLGALTSVRGAPASDDLVELVRGEWNAGNIVGHQVIVAFPAAGEPAASLGVDPAAIDLRVPTIAVQSVRPSDDPDAPASFRGNAITTSGTVVSPLVDRNDAVAGPLGEFLELDEAARARARATVASATFVANPGAFPDVDVSLSLLDATGRPVNGLDASDLQLLDDGDEQRFTLVGNAPPPLRVLVAYDGSGSIADFWTSPDARREFEERLAKGIVEGSSNVSFTVAVAPLGSLPGAFAPPDEATIGAALQLTSTSEIWKSAAEIPLRAGAAAVIVVSDFASDDDPTTIDRLRSQLAASHIPVIAVGVGPVDETTIEAIVTTSGGVRLDPSSADFSSQIATFLDEHASVVGASTYRLRYRLPDPQPDEGSSRSVTVRVTGEPPIVAEATYVVPEIERREVPSGIGGLYLEIVVGTTRSTRRLSGPRLAGSGVRVATSPTRADVEESTAVVLGLTMVGFEPGAPTTSASAESVIASMLSFERLYSETGKPWAETMEAARGAFAYSSMLGAVMQAGPTGSARLTAPEWLRVAVITDALTSEGVRRRFDVPPELNRVVSGASDPATAFRHAMTTSLQTSLWEQRIAIDSAARRLEGASLVALMPLESPSKIDDRAQDFRSPWAQAMSDSIAMICLVPTDPTIEAYWIVDPATGSAVAMTLDGRGGAELVMAAAGCGSAAGYALLAQALNLFSLYLTWRAYTCAAAEATREPHIAFACLGAFVGSMVSGVMSIVAATTLDDATLADVLFLVASSLPIAWGYGEAVGIANFLYSLYSTGSSLNEKCFH